MKNLAFLLFLLPILGFGQQKLFNSQNEVVAFTKKATLLFSENNPMEAFDIMRVYWPLPETELDLIRGKAVKGLNLMENQFGKSIGVEKIKLEKINQLFIREVYFIKYSKTVVRFIYTYYHNGNGWLLNSFKFDENWEEEF